MCPDKKMSVGPIETRPWSQHSVMFERQKQTTRVIRVDSNQRIDLSFDHQPLYHLKGICGNGTLSCRMS